MPKVLEYAIRMMKDQCYLNQ